MKPDHPRVAVIGGSLFYQMDGMERVRTVSVRTPFGKPSDRIVVGTVSGVRVAFLPRHGQGHTLMPTEVNSRANICALKSLGVEQIISVSLCGSLKEEIHPGEFVVPTQIYDRTRSRSATFYGNGIVGHTSFADPFCWQLNGALVQAAADMGLPTHSGGTYVCIEGPMFSTRAESRVYRVAGFDVIGMTNLPEAKLAREAELCYSTIGLVTDYDVWKTGREVKAMDVIAMAQSNVEQVKRLLRTVLPRLTRVRICPCASAAHNVVITDPKKISPRARARLRFILGRYEKKK